MPKQVARERRCEYHEMCGLHALASPQGSLCVLHSRDPSKSRKEFAKALRARVEKGDYSFDHFWFPASEGDFSRIVFEGNASFIGATFEGKADFMEVTFAAEVSFKNAAFGGDVSFVGTTFKGRAVFEDATFQGEVNCANAVFVGAASFDRSVYGAQANFSTATFGGRAHFAHCAFDEAHFYATVFGGAATFARATFAGTADFILAHFKDEGHLNETVFEKEAYFDRGSFERGACFNTALFKDMAAFVGASLFSPAHETRLVSVLFEQPEKVYFDGTDLSKCSFLRTDLRNVNFTAVQWARMRSRVVVYDEIQARKAGSREQYLLVEQLYTQLKQHWEDQHSYETAGYFHYGEMEMRRKARRLWKDPLLWLYWLSSGYGDNSARAFLCTALMWCGFACYYLLDPIYLSLSWSERALAALNRSLQVMTLHPPPSESLFQTIQSILGPLQIALFGLAVRRRLSR